MTEKHRKLLNFYPWRDYNDSYSVIYIAVDVNIRYYRCLTKSRFNKNHQLVSDMLFKWNHMIGGVREGEIIKYRFYE